MLIWSLSTIDFHRLHKDWRTASGTTSYSPWSNSTSWACLSDPCRTRTASHKNNDFSKLCGDVNVIFTHNTGIETFHLINILILNTIILLRNVYFLYFSLDFFFNLSISFIDYTIFYCSNIYCIKFIQIVSSYQGNKFYETNIFWFKIIFF